MIKTYAAVGAIVRTTHLAQSKMKAKPARSYIYLSVTALLASLPVILSIVAAIIPETLHEYAVEICHIAYIGCLFDSSSLAIHGRNISIYNIVIFDIRNVLIYIIPFCSIAISIIITSVAAKNNRMSIVKFNAGQFQAVIVFSAIIVYALVFDKSFYNLSLRGISFRGGPISYLFMTGVLGFCGILIMAVMLLVGAAWGARKFLRGE